ncbi:hypothetical protein ACBY01_06655 [Sphingomonas sp. ac-8]|uniref:hypothetical protein n=1 Tax=Sphingomonas sp. ac-8 TaxID=3242977 RepID=UPI003A80E3DB
MSKAIGGGDREVAENLMRMALALLDRAHCTVATAHLQLAIDTLVEDVPREPTPEEIARFLDRPAKDAGGAPRPGDAAA